MGKFTDIIRKEPIVSVIKPKRRSRRSTRPSHVAPVSKAGLDNRTLKPSSTDPYRQKEEAKFNAMTKGELLERLKSMRNPAKLKAFILTAIDRNSEDLLVAASEHARSLRLGYLIPRSASTSKVGKKDIGIGKDIPSTRQIRIE